MKKTFKLYRVMAVVATSALLWTTAATATFSAETSPSEKIVKEFTNTLVKAKGFPSVERVKLYQTMVFDLTKMAYGDSLFTEPYGVVTYYNPADAHFGARIRVWTGVLIRNGQTMETAWDELWLDPNGHVILASTDNQAFIDGYFDAASQNDYRTVSYLGIAPWGADIPTDPEAKARGISRLSADGMKSVYGIDLGSWGVEMSPGQDDVKPSAILPQVFKEFHLPHDANGHWAESYIRELLIRKVVQGYEDDTIRPDNTLTRAEFTALLVRILNLPAVALPADVYPDAQAHWAKGEIGAALSCHLIDAAADNKTFRPDDAITRLEMAGMLAQALKQNKMQFPSQSKGFTDTNELSKPQKSELQAVSESGLVDGYPDGTFKPAQTLVRSEAFKVIATYYHIQH